MEDADLAAAVAGGGAGEDATQVGEPVPGAQPLPGSGDATMWIPSTGGGGVPADATPPRADHTRVMPPAATAWEGRAEVRPQHPGLRDSAPYPVTSEPPQRSRTWWTPLLLGLLALALVGVVILAAWLLGRSAAPDPLITETPGPVVPTSAAPVEPTTPAAPSPTPSPTAAELVMIPPLIGDTQNEATGKLDAAGLSYRLQFSQSNSPRGTVIAMDPSAGVQVPRLTTVVLVISTGQGDATPTTRPTPTASAEPGGDD